MSETCADCGLEIRDPGTAGVCACVCALCCQPYNYNTEDNNGSVYKCFCSCPTCGASWSTGCEPDCESGEYGDEDTRTRLGRRQFEINYESYVRPPNRRAAIAHSRAVRAAKQQS